MPPRGVAAGRGRAAPRARRGRGCRTARADPGALATRWCAIGRVARRPGSWSWSSRLPRPATAGRGRSARCARATRCSPSRSRDPREAELPAVGRLALVDPETGRACRGRHLVAAACASASRSSRRGARAAWRASCAACASTTSAVSTEGDWLRAARAEAAGELRHPDLAARAAGDPAGARRAARAAAGARAATPFASPRCAPQAGRRRDAAHGAATSPPRCCCSPLAALGARARPPADAPWPCRLAARRSCWSPTTRGRWRPPTFSPTASPPPRPPPTTSSAGCRTQRAARRGGVLATAPTPSRLPTDDHAQARRVIDGRSPGGATATGEALEVALQALTPGAHDGPAPAVRDHPAVGRPHHHRPRPGRGRPRGRQAPHPDLHGRARHRERADSQSRRLRSARAGAARSADAAGDRPDLRRPRLHRRRRQRAVARSTARSAASSAASTRSARSPPRSPWWASACWWAPPAPRCASPVACPRPVPPVASSGVF